MIAVWQADSTTSRVCAEPVAGEDLLEPHPALVTAGLGRIRAGQLEARVERRVGIEPAVAGKVDMGGLRQQPDERRLGRGGLVQRVAGAVGEEAGDLLELGPGEGQRLGMRLRVAHPDEDRRLRVAGGQGGASRPQDERARGVADVELVEQAARLAVHDVRRGVERQQAEQARRQEDDAGGLQLA